MEITLITLNDNTLEFGIEKIIDFNNEYKDAEIIYGGDDVCIICRDNHIETINKYKKALLKHCLKETSAALKKVNEDISYLNSRYFGLLNKLI